ncbi:metallophosphoesterase [Fictibacillus phosphorivorans]|uniref:metallophosphoesterase n=1 Tax=Fictibacillus phosphorivorans TaxID=1221500 RepID=UPI0020419EB7|nr:metallophosphoesterase [Fictibacillus phosphorivorans]MCM3720309.1 metallophosphoesterase family protein [Fictibacillus phosphorivorans]MCM3777999.1 metallophosphoesterase family protein [Fictibacillus phosphorivorans]
MIYVLLVAGLILLLYMYIEAHRNRVSLETVKIDKLPISFKDYKIFFISDIHRRTITNQLLEKAVGADIVIIGGDLLEKGVPMARVEHNIKMLSKIGPVYFVWGNNDYDEDVNLLTKTILSCGVTILDNTNISLHRDKDVLDIAGVNDLSFKKDRLEDAIMDCRSSCRILISHNPDISRKITQDHQIRLVLSGHTHGGQIRLGPLGIAKRGGWYDEGFYKLLVSNGFGATHLPLRLCAPCEAHLITLG